jgi:hypothetical protein
LSSPKKRTKRTLKRPQSGQLQRANYVGRSASRSDGAVFTPSKERVAIIILGMHRSGTSAMAGAVSLLGATSPSTLMPADQHNEKGYWESLEIYRLNDSILESAGSSWHDWRKFSDDWYNTARPGEFEAAAKKAVLDEYGSSSFFVMKDPRICRLGRFWVKILDEMRIAARFVMPVRSPLEVAYSLQRVHGLSLNVGILLWLRNVLDAELFTRARPRSVLLLSELLKDWRTQFRKLERDLKITWPRYSDLTATQVDQFLTVQLRHFSASDTDLKQHPDVHDWVSRTYDALQNIALGRRVPDALATLDNVRGALDAASPIFGRALADTEYRLEESKKIASEIGPRDERVRELEGALLSTQQEAKQYQELSVARDVHIQEIEPELAARQAEIATLRNNEVAHQARIGDLEEHLRREISVRDERVRELEGALLSTQQEAKQYQKLSVARDVHIQEIEPELAARQAEIATLHNEIAFRDELKSQLTIDLVAAKTDATSHRDLNALHARRVEELESTLLIRNNEIDRLEAQIAYRDVRVKELEATLLQMQNETQYHVDLSTARDGHIGELEIALADCQANIERLCANIVINESEIQDLRKELIVKEIRNGESRNTGARLQKQLNEVQTELEHMKRNWITRLQLVFTRRISDPTTNQGEQSPRLLLGPSQDPKPHK